MAFSASRVTVLTTATAIVALSSGNPANLNIRNRGSESIYLGGSGVTAANGYELEAGDQVFFQLCANESVYGIVAGVSARADVARNLGTIFQ